MVWRPRDSGIVAKRNRTCFGKAAGKEKRLRVGAAGFPGAIRCVQFARLTDTVLRSLSAELDALYADSGRPSIAPEYILRGLLLQVFYSVRSERLLVEQIDYNLLFRWFVGLGMDDARCGTTRCSPRTATVC